MEPRTESKDKMKKKQKTVWILELKEKEEFLLIGNLQRKK